MNAALIGDEDRVIQIISVRSEADIAALNERAQDIAGMEWRPARPEDWRQLGELGALFASVNFGGNDHE